MGYQLLFFKLIVYFYLIVSIYNKLRNPKGSINKTYEYCKINST